MSELLKKVMWRCGKLLGPVVSYLKQGLPRKHKNAMLGFTLVVGLLLCLLMCPSAPDRQETKMPVGASQRPAEPPPANVTLHAYDLLKNPYQYRNRTIVLNVMERPIMYHGSVVQYANIGGVDARIATQFSLMGVRFNRMISEDTALYDILGTNAEFNASSEPEMLGQIGVILPPGRADLDLGRYWFVEPLGSMEGTNAFGAVLQAPQVRFLRYTDERYQANGGKASEEGAQAQSHKVNQSAQDAFETEAKAEEPRIEQFKATKSGLITKSLGLTATSSSEIFWTINSGFYKSEPHVGHKFIWASADAAKDGKVFHYTWQYDLVDGQTLATNDEARLLEENIGLRK
jgi:hypothetical protein